MRRSGKALVFLLLLTPAAWASEKRVEVSVNGMVCGFCAQGIEKKFHAQPAVEQVKVNLGEKLVKLELREGKTLDDGTITKILTDSGYTVQKIERK